MNPRIEKADAAGRRGSRQRAAFGAGLLALVLLTGLAGCGSGPQRQESASVAAERLYRDGQDDMASGSFERAIQNFQRVEGLAAGSLLAQQAQLNIAYLHWRNDSRADALTAIERFIKLHPSSPALDYALYLRGVINFQDSVGFMGRLARQNAAERDQRASRDSYEAFRQLVDQFPESRYTPDARLRMDYIVNSLAEHEAHVARYYLRRGAYLAAANRAQQVLTQYPQTPATREALQVMVESYDKLALPQLRDAAQRVLQQNFAGTAAGRGAAPAAPAGMQPPAVEPTPAPIPAPAAPARPAG